MSYVHECPIPPVSERPRCLRCGKPLVPIYVDRPRREGDDPWTVYRVGVDGYGYGGHGVFCSLRCGYYWALRNGARQP